LSSRSSSPNQALTPASITAAIAALCISAFLTQWAEVVLFTAPSAEFAVSLPAAAVLALLIASITVAGFARLRLLNRTELVTVYFILAISAPLMTQGFWQRIVSISTTLPQSQEFEKYDSISSRLWPHGRNLLAGYATLFAEKKAVVAGDVREEGQWLVFTNTEQSQTPAQVRFPVPIGKDGLAPGEGVMGNFLVRLSDLSATSRYSAGFRDPESGRYLPILEGRSGGRPNPVLPEGVTRVGQYGVQVPSSASGQLWLEITLYGPGRAEISDIQLLSIAALEALQSGLQSATPAQMSQVPAADLGRTLTTAPAWSAGWLLERIGIGFIPWTDWLVPIALWTLLLVALLTGSFGLNLLFRHRWVDGERVPMPMTRIPLMMMGEPLQPGDEPIRFWNNRLMWGGFAVSFLWACLRGWHFYNPDIPDLSIEVPLQAYFSPGWGNTWQITFTLSLIYLSLSIFVDSSILLSVVVGFILYRLLFFVGLSSGWNTLPKYPYAAYQQVGGFFAYALVLLFFARRQLVAALRKRGEGARIGLGMVALSFGGAALWGWLNGMAAWQTMLWMAFLLVISLVSTRFRVECATPIGYFTPTNVSYTFFLIGGFTLFSNDFLLTSYTLSFVLLAAVFFLAPGAQFEYMEVSRRMKVPLGQMLGASAIGVFGGILIGGLVFLLVAYHFGAVALVNTWSLSPKLWYFTEFNAEMARAAAQAQGSAPGGVDVASWIAIGYGAGGTILIALLRQAMAAFWFHPFGFIIGTTPLAANIWSSVLIAWGIRTITLKLGGARMLRHGLQPVFGGVFLGALAAWALFILIGSYVLGSGSPLIYSQVP